MSDKEMIQTAYDRLRPTDEQKTRMLESVLLHTSDSAPAGKDGSMKKRFKKTMLIAAVISVMAILMGAGLVVMRLENMKIGQITITVPTRPTTGNTSSEPKQPSQPTEEMPTMLTRDVIALFGYDGSANQLATRDWFAYNQSIGFQEFQSEEEMNAILTKYGHTYCVANWDMAEKLEEIADAHHLQLLAPEILVQKYQNEAMFTALGLEDLHRDEAEAVVKYYSGRMYQEGGFEIDMTVILTGADASWPYLVGPTVRYMQKEYFYPRYTYLDIDSTDQWMYETADGSQVLLITDGKQAIIVHDQGDAFLTVTVMMEWAAGDTVTYPDCHTLEQVADVFDYSIRPQKPDIPQTKRLFDQAEKDYDAQQEAERAEAEAEWDKIDSWEEYFSRGDGIRVEEERYYTLKDFNGDGVDELFLSDNPEYFTGSLTIAGGDHCHYIWPGTEEGYFCEGNVIEIYADNESRTSHLFLTLKSNYRYPDNFAVEPAPIFEKIEYIEYDKHTGIWTKSAGQDKPRTEITQEEANRIIQSYSRIPMHLKPVEEFLENDHH